MRLSHFPISYLLAGAIAAPNANSNRHVVHERRDHLLTHWNKNFKMHPDSYIPMRIALTQNNLDKAHEYLMDVSDPESPNFGKHWSAKQVAETFAPSDESVSKIMEWLSDFGITGVKQSQSLNWIHANVTISQAEDLLHTEYFEFKHAITGQSHVACEKYSLPKHIQEHVDFVTPTTHFDSKVENSNEKRQLDLHKRDNSKSHSIGSAASKSHPIPQRVYVPPDAITTDLRGCNISIFPLCIRTLYGLPATYVPNTKNSFGIVEYTPQAYLASDLDMFFRNFSSKQVGDRPILDSIDGGVIQTTDQSYNLNGESDTDFEYSMALTYPQMVTLYQTGDLAQGASFNNFLDAIDGTYCSYEGGDDPNSDGIYPDPAPAGYGVYKGPENCGGFSATKVISSSYGINEADISSFYANRQCNEYMKLGLQGATVIYASGDYGVAGEGGQCIDRKTGAYNDGTDGRFNPSFPGTCPYVTSVGATQIQVDRTVTQPETAAESVIYSGGGFSNVFPMPTYQEAAVKKYLSIHNPSYGSREYNNSMKTRGYPDVAANGVNYVAAINGLWQYNYGTSFSAPTFASVITLINSARLDAGKGPIGFINPTLYANPSVLNDINEGGNRGCGTSGFRSVTGWDPVTGLGTPNYPKMLKLWLSLP